VGFAVGAALAVLLLGLWWWNAQNVETPSYRVLERDGDFEVRGYPELVAAEVERDGARWDAVRRGFGPLAGYIFAKARGGQKIAMTAPVTQQRTSTAAASGPGPWRVRFIMPSKYALEDLPEPAQSDVRLVKVESATVAAVRFSGVATDELIAKQQEKLLNWLSERAYAPTGAPTYAYYNDPFTPGFLRRNEVLVEVSAQSPGTR
jgi:hypothetical protein